MAMQQVEDQVDDSGVDSPSDVDYKSLHEESQTQISDLETRISKLENDSKSRAGSSERNRTLVSRIESLQDQMAALVKGLGVLGQGQASGDMDEVPTKLAGISAEVERARTAGVTEDAYQDLLGNLIDAAKSVSIDLYDKAPGPFDEVKKRWDAAKVADNKLGFAAAIADAYRVVGQLRENQSQEAKSREQEVVVKATRKQVVEDLEVNDLDAGGGSGGGSGSPDEIWRAYGRGERSWSPAVKEAGKKLGAL
mgnify:FL=1